MPVPAVGDFILGIDLGRTRSAGQWSGSWMASPQTFCARAPGFLKRAWTIPRDSARKSPGTRRGGMRAWAVAWRRVYLRSGSRQTIDQHLDRKPTHTIA